jgi:hypothetical protein
MLQLWLVANTVLWPFNVKLGGITLSLNVVVLLLAGAVWLAKSRRIAIASAKILLVFIAFIFFSLFLALTGPCNDHLQKSIFTMPILLLLVLIGLEIGRKASDVDWLNLQRTALWSLILAFSALFFEMLMPAWFPLQAGYRSEGKLSGLFQEPSHLAFSLFPCIAVLLVAEDKKTSRKGIVALFGLLVLSRSSTLIALIAAFVLYRLVIQGKTRQTALITLSISSFIGLAAMIGYSQIFMPTIVRVAGITAPSETGNLSSLVYVQGWQDAWFNLWRTHGLGLGLNMMGCSPLPDVSVRDILMLRRFGDLNAEDGSFLFAKIVSETGVVGLGFYAMAIWGWIQLERKLRYLHEEADRLAAATQAALIFCFIASSFIRGAGYFAGGLLLWIAAISGAARWRRNLSTQPAMAFGFTPPARQIAGDRSSDDNNPRTFAARREDQ